MACSAEISHFREHGGRDAARWISWGRGALDLASSPFAPLRRFADGWFTCPFSFRKPRFLIVSPTQSPAYSPTSPAVRISVEKNTSGCLLAPLEGSLPSFRERGASRFPSTHSCAPLRSIHQRETLGVHSFRPGGAVGDGRRRRTCRGLCLWPSRRRRPRLDCRWSSWR